MALSQKFRSPTNTIRAQKVSFYFKSSISIIDIEMLDGGSNTSPVFRASIALRFNYITRL